MADYSKERVPLAAQPARQSSGLGGLSQPLDADPSLGFKNR